MINTARYNTTHHQIFNITVRYCLRDLALYCFFSAPFEQTFFYSLVICFETEMKIRRHFQILIISSMILYFSYNRFIVAGRDLTTHWAVASIICPHV